MGNAVRFAFYKPEWGYIVGQVISIWTWIWNLNTPAYSHVEIGFLENGKWRYYSAASKGDKGGIGTRWIASDKLFKHPKRWDIYEVTPILSIKLMKTLCAAELDKDYDWWGIAGFMTITGQLNSKVKWYCSEICYYVFFGEWRKRVSPRKLYSILRKMKPKKIS